MLYLTFCLSKYSIVGMKEHFKSYIFLLNIKRNLTLIFLEG